MIDQKKQKRISVLKHRKEQLPKITSEYYNNENISGKFFEENRSAEQLLKDLGEQLYLIYGSYFETEVKYRNYKVRIIRKIETKQAFVRMKVNIYEDDYLIIENTTIGFWPLAYGDSKACDVEWSWNETCLIYKYDNGYPDCICMVLDRMKDKWNEKFSNKERKNLQPYIYEFVPEEVRRDIIRQIEKKIKNNRTNSKFYLRANLKYKNLEDLLEFSGLVYKIERKNIYIMDVYIKQWYLLKGISEYDESYKRYEMYILP